MSLRFVKYICLVLCCVLLLFGLVRLLWPAASSSPNPETNHRIAQTQPAATGNRTVATEWDWSQFESLAETAGETVEAGEPESFADPDMVGDIQFDVDSIYQALHQVKLDDSDNIIIDDVVLRALNQALVYSNVEWTPEKIYEFTQIVRSGLPEVAAEQAVRLIEDFHEYQLAKREFFQLMGDTGSNLDYATQFDELVSLRRLYLGSDVAKQLFAREEAEARYMLSSMKLAKNRELNADERQLRQADVYEEFVNRAPDVPDWDYRFQQFQAHKQDVLQSGLSVSEMQKQVQELMTQHFSQAELARAAHLNLEQLQPDQIN